MRTLLTGLSCATALAAASGSAAAQSSITAFGVVDLSLRWLDNGGVSQVSMAQGGVASSRLGFRGSEDLGGGLRAGFWLEGAMDPSNGTSSGQTWQRRSTVSLSNRLGELRLGRDTTATYRNTVDFDPFGDSGIGAAGHLTVVPPGLPPGGAYNTLVRASNMFAYFLPSGTAGGLYGQAQVAPGENLPGDKFAGGRIGYQSGRFNGALAYGQTQVSSDTNGENFNVAGSWSFSVFELSGFYGQIKVGDDRQQNWFVGAKLPYGLWNLRASFGQVSLSGTSPDVVDGQKASQFAIGAIYDLSIRTALYGTWSSIRNQGGASYVVGSLNDIPNGGAAPNAKSQGVEFGIRHSF